MNSRRKHSTFFADPPPALPGRAEGFSLVELLMVMAVIVVVMSLTVPAVVGLQRSYQLTKAATQVKDNLQLARQLAMTRNESIVASFSKAKDDLGNQSYNVLTLSRMLSSGTLSPISKPIRLAGGIGISGDVRWSSIMDPSLSGTCVLQRTALPCQQIRFKASGATVLTSTSSWYLTLFYNPNSATPPANFVTLVIDPVTSRIVWNQP